MRTSPAFIPAVAAAAFGCLLTAPVAALADDGENTALNLPSDTSTQAVHHAGAGGGIIRTIVGLLVVVAIIYGLTWVLKKVKTSKETAASGTTLESLATLPLGTNRSLHLVRAGRELVLLGSSEHGVTPIRRFSEAEAQALGLLEAPQLEQPVNATVEALGGTPAKAKPMTIGDLIENLRSKTVVK